MCIVWLLRWNECNIQRDGIVFFHDFSRSHFVWQNDILFFSFLSIVLPFLRFFFGGNFSIRDNIIVFSFLLLQFAKCKAIYLMYTLQCPKNVANNDNYVHSCFHTPCNISYNLIEKLEVLTAQRIRPPISTHKV